jgi:hypothetical protein
MPPISGKYNNDSCLKYRSVTRTDVNTRPSCVPRYNNVVTSDPTLIPDDDTTSVVDMPPVGIVAQDGPKRQATG